MDSHRPDTPLDPKTCLTDLVRIHAALSRTADNLNDAINHTATLNQELKKTGHQLEMTIDLPDDPPVSYTMAELLDSAHTLLRHAHALAKIQRAAIEAALNGAIII